MLDRQNMDVIEDVPVGAKVSVPVVDAGVDARVGLHSSCSRCRNLHDMVEHKSSCSIFEGIDNFLGIFHSDIE